MAIRDTLAVSKLDDFKQWLIKDGWQIQNVKGYNEALRAVKPGRKNPLIIYQRDRTNKGSENITHLTVLDRDMGVVKAYLKKRNMDDIDSKADTTKKMAEYIYNSCMDYCAECCADNKQCQAEMSKYLDIDNINFEIPRPPKEYCIANIIKFFEECEN